MDPAFHPLNMFLGKTVRSIRQAWSRRRPRSETDRPLDTGTFPGLRQVLVDLRVSWRPESAGAFRCRHCV